MSILEKYYDYVLNNVIPSQEELIAFKILSDITDRRGLRQEWDNIDDDIKEEIINGWIEIVKTNV